MLKKVSSIQVVSNNAKAVKCHIEQATFYQQLIEEAGFGAIKIEAVKTYYVLKIGMNYIGKINWMLC